MRGGENSDEQWRRGEAGLSRVEPRERGRGHSGLKTLASRGECATSTCERTRREGDGTREGDDGAEKSAGKRSHQSTTSPDGSEPLCVEAREQRRATAYIQRTRSHLLVSLAHRSFARGAARASAPGVLPSRPSPFLLARLGRVACALESPARRRCVFGKSASPCSGESRTASSQCAAAPRRTPREGDAARPGVTRDAAVDSPSALTRDPRLRLSPAREQSAARRRMIHRRLVVA